MQDACHRVKPSAAAIFSAHAIGHRVPRPRAGPPPGSGRSARPIQGPFIIAGGLRTDADCPATVLVTIGGCRATTRPRRVHLPVLFAHNIRANIRGREFWRGGVREMARRRSGRGYRVMPRIWSFAVALMLFASGGAGAVAAEEATPAANEYGLPELALTITATEIRGVPVELAAGRYLVTLTVEAGEGVEFGDVGFVLLPAGRTVADLAPSAAGSEASPMVDDPFAWRYGTYIAGGPGGDALGIYQAIVDLPPGEYGVWGDDPDATQPAVPLTVTGSLDPASLAEPIADVTIRELKTADGFAFEVEGTLVVGPQVIEIVNESDQPHFVADDLSSAPITVEQLFAFFESFETGTPVPGVSEGQFSSGIYAAIQSAGSTQWVVADLQAGYHVVGCYVPDPTRDGVPHAFEGMIKVVPVGVDGATPAP